ncbi:hypothetical protein C5167_010938 [Papaver somniferum]|uniref:Peptidase S9 prolyl oligopeptidase catalytic domain-containing protein n=1 Tax=Papaver somniferum TaxID=3469 RepID=A0A4Y7K345_PAPSO|nr:hypothetical protein C5167_010938 [Papaver somniferum]
MASSTSTLPGEAILNKKIIAPYGSWKSPITAEVVAGAEKRLSGIAVDVTAVSSGLNLALTKLEPKVLVGGNDFYAFPRLDSKGERLAWIEWGHPNMPWDKAQLWVGYISKDGDISQRICVAGGDPMLVESPSEPKWSSKGELFFITDRKSGFWNLYKWIEHRNEVVSIYSIDAEFTKPFWVFGASSFDFIPTNGNNNLISCSYRGPADESRGVLDLNIQYWTSRGWAYVDVNYGGSTVKNIPCDDKVMLLLKFDNGKVDGERLCITGKSAGGYTTLASLAFRQTFKAGSEDAFFERSPINFVDKFSCPVILFQGLDDKIVTPEQARKIHMALKHKGLPVALVEYEGESHGFRKL